MPKNIDRAFDIMRERNRRYLESQKQAGEDPAKADDAGAGAGAGEGAQPPEGNPLPELPGLTEEQKEELRQAEEKRRAYQEANTGAAGFYRVGQSDDELAEGERKAAEFHAEENRLEKGDFPAMLLSALIVFGPIFLVLFALLFLAWLFLH